MSRRKKKRDLQVILCEERRYQLLKRRAKKLTPAREAAVGRDAVASYHAREFSSKRERGRAVNARKRGERDRKIKFIRAGRQTSVN